MMGKEMGRAAEVKKQLDVVSSTFCLAKWLQTTMLLQNGQTHSCHHTPMHKVDLLALRDNPSALHNTVEKQMDRADMLNGERPVGCDYCWRIEDLPGDHPSDRIFKSASPWAHQYIPEVLQEGVLGPINPTYFEVSFSNVCNFKCAYCSPDISSQWMSEIKQHGGYPVSTGSRGLEMLEQSGRIPIPNREKNPYVEAFWKWWPDLYQSLRVFRITGGEPLLDANTFQVFEYILKHPRPDLVLGMNSNMNVSKERQAVLTSYVQEFERENSIKLFQLFTSAEATDDQCNYIRHGMDYAQYVRNVDAFLKQTERASVTVMAAFNIMSVTTFVDFVDAFIVLRQKYGDRVRLSLNYVRSPQYLDARILTPSLKRHYADAFINKFTAHEGLTDYEQETGLRLADDLMQDVPDRDVRVRDFHSFIREHDRRRGTDFHSVFPELIPLYEEGRQDG